MLAELAAESTSASDSGNLNGVVYLSSQSLGKHLLRAPPAEGTALGHLSCLSWEGLPVLMAARRAKIGLMGSVAFGPHFWALLPRVRSFTCLVTEGHAVPAPQGGNRPLEKGS